MANKESGHLVNASNFIEKVNVIERHKDQYQPTNPAIMVDALLPVKQLVKDALVQVSLARSAFSTAVSDRKNEYAVMDKLASRIIAFLKSSEATPNEIKQGETLLDKYKSIRVSEKPNEEKLKAKALLTGEEVKIPKTISVNQQGFVNKLGHFKDIVLFIKTVPAYKPNETDIAPDTLDTFIVKVEGLNDKRNELSESLSKAIDARDTLMYREPDGAFYLAKKITAYISGSKTKNSLLFKELSKYPVRAYK